MVEGHACHALAQRHRATLRGRRFSNTHCAKPVLRCVAAAEPLCGSRLLTVQVQGKNMFYVFDNGITMHVHFGMSGRFRALGDRPVPQKSRALFDVEGITYYITCMKWRLLRSPEEVAAVQSRLGVDPVHHGPEAPPAVQGWQLSKRRVADLLMDQSRIAGIGNIYRSEVLFLASVHPMLRGVDLTPEKWREVWTKAHDALCLGVQKERVVSLDAESRRHLECSDSRRELAVYGQTECCRCRGTLLKLTLSARSVYFCPDCQPHADPKWGRWVADAGRGFAALEPVARSSEQTLRAPAKRPGELTKKRKRVETASPPPQITRSHAPVAPAHNPPPLCLSPVSIVALGQALGGGTSGKQMNARASFKGCGSRYGVARMAHVVCST